MINQIFNILKCLLHALVNLDYKGYPGTIPKNIDIYKVGGRDNKVLISTVSYNTDTQSLGFTSTSTQSLEIFVGLFINKI